MRPFFCPAPRDGHSFFDIKGYVARRLAQLGLRDVHALPCDTYAEEERFFSYRRACHKQETGEQRKYRLRAGPLCDLSGP